MRTLLISLVAVLVWAVPATASDLIITYDGTVVSGIDPIGVFGAVGADLTGDPYHIVVTYDASQLSFGVDKALTSLVVKIGGTEYSPVGVTLASHFSEVEYVSNPPPMGLVTVFQDQDQVRASNFFFELGEPFTTFVNIEVEPNAVTASGDCNTLFNLCGIISLTSSLPKTIAGSIALGSPTFSQNGLPPIVFVDDVPEPRTWVFMLIGIFLSAKAARSHFVRGRSGLAAYSTQV